MTKSLLLHVCFFLVVVVVVVMALGIGAVLGESYKNKTKKKTTHPKNNRALILVSMFQFSSTLDTYHPCAVSGAQRHNIYPQMV